MTVIKWSRLRALRSLNSIAVSSPACSQVQWSPTSIPRNDTCLWIKWYRTSQGTLEYLFSPPVINAEILKLVDILFLVSSSERDAELRSELPLAYCASPVSDAIAYVGHDGKHMIRNAEIEQ
ncbi:hypothetical protein TNCV_2852971 [Trichonephila clavipes]|uniref:Uncharacterized protein n=1 Tax=Trichonephila clavipes TaxID=2585209 RepID=A0A8X6UYR9_TRICX|nr:hypothetical protein TNCV_2852971 [Trichonephila clavipes]